MRHRAASPSAEAMRSTHRSIHFQEYSCQGILRRARECATLATVISDDERIALFLDYENLAIGARDGLGVSPFDFGPVADALAERGRVVARRAYADWSAFDEDRRLHGPGPGRAHRDPAAARRLAEERRRHQDGGRRDRAGVRAQLHHDVRDRHRRLRLHPARPQAAGDGQAGDRHRRAVVHLEAAPARLRRVPVLRPAARRRAAPAARSRRWRRPPWRTTRTSRRWSPRRWRASPGTPTVPCSPRASSAPCCARTRRSTRPTTASAASASSCATWRAAGW